MGEFERVGRQRHMGVSLTGSASLTRSEKGGREGGREGGRGTYPIVSSAKTEEQMYRIAVRSRRRPERMAMAEGRRGREGGREGESTRQD